jgi:SAM-dependent methyltransferase
MKLIPHSDEWYIWLSQKQQGYFYPGERILPLWHGEDNFLSLVMAHLKPDMDVLEAGCAQGELALAIAPHVRSVLAYDAIPNYIGLACEEARERGITNVRFVVHNSRSRYNGGQPRMPAEDRSVDLWVSSKGPGHAMKDAPRVLRPGGVMLNLLADGGAPSGRPPRPWNGLLPEPWRSLGDMTGRDDPNGAYKWITGDLAEVGVKLHSWWDIDVPVYIPTPRDLYLSLAWAFQADEVPSYDEVEQDFERIFAEFAGPQGVEERWRRSIWKAVVPRN